MNHIRILAVTGWYPSLLEPMNGDFVKEQVRILRALGWKIDVVFADHNIRYLKQGQIGRRKLLSMDQNGNYDLISSGPTLPKNNSLGLQKWIKDYSDLVFSFIGIYQKPDIIIAHTYLGCAVAKIISERKTTPIIGIEHYTGWLDNSYKSSHFKLAQSGFRQVDKLYAVSHSLADKMRSLFGCDADVLPNIIDAELFKPIETPKSTFKLIGIGDLIERKQWDHALEAIARLANKETEVHFDIIGNGPLLSALTSTCHDLGIEKHVTFQGLCMKSEVARLLQETNILIHTSRTETFGIIYAEALSTGVPVISYKNDGVKEFQNCEGVITTIKNTPESLANELLAFDQASYQSQAIRESYLSLFGTALLANRLEEQIIQLVSKKNT